MTDNLSQTLRSAVERVKARLDPHYGIDGATDSLQLANDCRTIIAALEGQEAALDHMTVVLPERPDTDLINILGRPNFGCMGIANTLRSAGWEIKQSAEAEQANVIFFTLCLWAKYGKDWAEKGDEELAAMKASQKAGR